MSYLKILAIPAILNLNREKGKKISKTNFSLDLCQKNEANSLYNRIIESFASQSLPKKKKIVTNRTGNPIFSILRVKESRDFITRPMFFSPADALPYIFSSHVVSFLLFVSRPADIPDNSFPTPTWLPISRCNCHLREDLSIGLNAAFSMRTGGTAPRPRFRETCEISVPNFCAPPVVHGGCLEASRGMFF